MREYCKPTLEDAKYLAEHLNPADKRETVAGIGKHIIDDIVSGIKYSDEIGCCRFDGVPIAIYGIRKPSPIADYGLAWLFLGEIKDEDRYYVARQTKRFVQAALERYRYIYNYVDVDNKKIIEWLKFLGAEFYGPEEYGLFGSKHFRFEIRRK